MTVAEALREAMGRLQHAGIDGAARDARLLLAHATEIAPERLTLHLSDTLSPDQIARLDEVVSARITRKPVSQIIGSRLFWGRRFRVTADVLDPRPETETLVEAALAEPFESVLDLGTGSGAILLTLLAERPTARGIGVDLSGAALDVAAGMAQALGLAGRCSLLVSNWFSEVIGAFDLIVANPPYIAEEEMDDLPPEVRSWEPRLALSPGGDGLDAYRAIVARAWFHLRPAGRLIMEIGPTQAEPVRRLLKAAGLDCIDVRLDMDGRDRVIVARRVAP